MPTVARFKSQIREEKELPPSHKATGDKMADMILR